ncbi:MAG: MFS transporter [Rhodospirillaceae bacterium]|nr:MFS transporter [Rhodospirillaceae bacterium]
MAEITSPVKTQATNWPIVWVAFGAGIVASSHIGKLPPALPQIGTDLAAGLVMSGWIASMISTMGFAIGLIAGAIADRVGQRRVLIFGMLMLALGSLLGTFASTSSIMLIARFIEGLGFTATTITGGAIIARATADSDRKWALGVWAAYMPIGFASMMMFAALILDKFGWRVLWGVSLAVTLIWIVVVIRATAEWQRSQTKAISRDPILGNVRRSLAMGGGVLVALCFALYATQHISMMNWLPTYMLEVYGVSTLFAATVPALVLVFNAIGNYLAAWAMGRGWPIWLLLALGAGGMALTEIGIFSGVLPESLRLGLAFLFGIAGGLIPAAALAAAPVYAPTPALIGTMSGLMVMGSNTGQLFGPPALAAIRETAGNWDSTLWLLLSLAIAGIIMAVLSRPMENRAATH